LRDHQSELAELGAKVLLISFSSAAKMQQWQRETGAPFPVVLDQHREAYKAYGLRRSYLHSWNARTIRTYVELHRAGRKWRGVQDDSAQLGGDFIIGGDGRVLFAHTSKDPVDRPDITELLSILRTST
jgi:alkyl hydroperoxide reductase subunit AhpC